MRKIFINDTVQISVAKLILIILVTLFQFLGMMADANPPWVATGAMYFLFANALFLIDSSDKARELERKNLIIEKDNLFKNNRTLIHVLENELKESKILITDLRDEVKGLKLEVVELKQQVKDLEIQLKNK